MSRTLLQVESSILGEASASRSLSNSLVSQWLAQYPADRLLVRDLAKDPVPPIDGVLMQGLATSDAERTPEMQQAVQRADELLHEFLVSDVVVIGAPMYNFSIPAVLHAWFDYLCRAGTTFRYTENGPEGLVKDKVVYIVSTRGGIHEGSPMDHQVPYLQTLLGFLGIEDVRLVQAEGLNLSEDHRERSLQAAEAVITEQLAEVYQAA